MDIQCDQTKDDIIVITPRFHALDANNANRFKEQVSVMISDQKKVVLYLGQVHFMDSSGCGALMTCLRTVHENSGKLIICGVDKPLRNLFELFRLNRLMNIYGSLEDALNAF